MSFDFLFLPFHFILWLKFKNLNCIPNFIFYLGSLENYFDFNNSGHEYFGWDYFEWTKSIDHN
jgi:hypothetical protein